MRSLVLAAAILLAGCISPPEDPSPEAAAGAIDVLGAIGNSLMLGYNADEDHIESAPEVAWATGDEPWSFRARLGTPRAENVAVPGAGVDTFLDQVEELVDADLVLVLLPDNAMCGPPEPDGTDFEAGLREGVRALLARGMTPMLVTPPDLIAVAEAARAKPPANDFVLFWATGQSCASDPRVAERQAAMVETIGRVAEEEGALHDHGAIASLAWTPEMISDMDGLHPSLTGLEAISAAVWDTYDLLR